MLRKEEKRMSEMMGMSGTRSGLWQIFHDYDWCPTDKLFEAVWSYVSKNAVRVDFFVAEDMADAYRTERKKRILTEMSLSEEGLTAKQSLTV